MATASCPGVIATGLSGEALCVDEMEQPIAWVAVESSDYLPVEAAELAEAFAAGFGIVFAFWGLGYVVSMLINVVRGR